ncbi:MAG: exodeoxyribonuclease [Microbacteriaceae bacterium]|nr:exodeoxyribonuclease [Microbacteriaceae bacterium]
MNGVRAAYGHGMGPWLAARDVDVLALQEVRAPTEILEELLGDEWNILHDTATAAGRAGVALASRGKAEIHRVELGDEKFDSAGRWLEADYRVGDSIVTVVSTYVHSGNVEDPKKMIEKYKFLDAMTKRLPEMTEHSPLAVVVGDLNVAHREIDLKNWRGNRNQAGFLVKERAYFDKFFAPEGKNVACVDGKTRRGMGWVDVGRQWAGEVEGPYTWWSARGQAFANDTGWRLDYHVATPGLAALAQSYTVDRAATYDERWSDHAPVVVDYSIN